MTAEWQVNEVALVDNDTVVGTITALPTGEWYATSWSRDGKDIQEVGCATTFNGARDILTLHHWGIDPKGTPADANPFPQPVDDYEPTRVNGVFLWLFITVCVISAGVIGWGLRGVFG